MKRIIYFIGFVLFVFIVSSCSDDTETAWPDTEADSETATGPGKTVLPVESATDTETATGPGKIVLPIVESDSTAPETDSDTTAPETDSDTTATETDSDTTAPETDSDTTAQGGCEEMKAFFDSCNSPGFPAPTYLQMQDYCNGEIISGYLAEVYECFVLPREKVPADEYCTCPGSVTGFLCGADDCEHFKNCMQICN